ncbi:MAG: hypothetical protein ACYDHU_02370 [Acidimicrobiales bacterium]
MYRGPDRARMRGPAPGCSIRVMKKLILLAVLITLGVVAAKRLRTT